MATVRITEAELARDVRAVLEQIEIGGEVIVEREDHRPVAVIKQPEPVGRKISECIALTSECIALTSECIALTSECIALTSECIALAKAYEEKLG